QHVGNFPGVTVDKHSGILHIKGQAIEVIDFPGTYSIYPRSLDEHVVYKTISDSSNPNFPDKLCVIVDSTNLERNLLLFTQLYDLKLPICMVLYMASVAYRNGITLDLDQLQQAFRKATIIRSNARIGPGIQEIKELMVTDLKIADVSLLS